MIRVVRLWLLIGCLAVAAAGCRRGDVSAPASPGGTGNGSTATAPVDLIETVTHAADRATSALQLRVPKASLKSLANQRYFKPRLDMVGMQIERRGVRDPRVLAGMRLTPRQEFVPLGNRRYSYYDSPLPIGNEQTISQPYIVALMTELLKPKPEHRILEIGTGSGYQAAVLAVLVKEVYTIEIVEPLAKRAAADLKRLGYSNVFTRAGDGYKGWPEKAPFDGVIVTAAPEKIPEPLLEQLKVGGRLVIPVGPQYSQELVVIYKTERGVFREAVIPVRFVPMTGEIQKREKR